VIGVIFVMENEKERKGNAKGAKQSASLTHH
jgi:hypothetical protein